MRIALHQGPPHHGDLEAAFGALHRATACGAAAGAAIAVLPELLLPGYGVADMQAQPADGPWIARAQATCRDAGCGAVVGFAERAGRAIHNSAAVIGPDGALIAVHRKLQLFGAREAALFDPGERHTLFDLDGVRCAVLVCYDVEFSAHVAEAARRGAELILVPTANMEPHRHVPGLLVRARAAESDVTIAYANWCGREGGIDYTGLSVIAGPGGEPLAAAGTGEAILVADLCASRAVPAAMRSTQARDFRGPGA